MHHAPHQPCAQRGAPYGYRRRRGGLRALPYTPAYLAEKLLTSRREKRQKHFIGLLGDCSYTSR